MFTHFSFKNQVDTFLFYVSGIFSFQIASSISTPNSLHEDRDHVDFGHFCISRIQQSAQLVDVCQNELMDG